MVTNVKEMLLASFIRFSTNSMAALLKKVICPVPSTLKALCRRTANGLNEKFYPGHWNPSAALSHHHFSCHLHTERLIKVLFPWANTLWERKKLGRKHLVNSFFLPSPMLISNFSYFFNSGDVLLASQICKQPEAKEFELVG